MANARAEADAFFRQLKSEAQVRRALPWLVAFGVALVALFGYALVAAPSEMRFGILLASIFMLQFLIQVWARIDGMAKAKRHYETVRDA